MLPWHLRNSSVISSKLHNSTNKLQAGLLLSELLKTVNFFCHIVRTPIMCTRIHGRAPPQFSRNCVLIIYVQCWSKVSHIKCYEFPVTPLRGGGLTLNLSPPGRLENNFYLNVRNFSLRLQDNRMDVQFPCMTCKAVLLIMGEAVGASDLQVEHQLIKFVKRSSFLSGQSYTRSKITNTTTSENALELSGSGEFTHVTCLQQSYQMV